MKLNNQTHSFKGLYYNMEIFIKLRILFLNKSLKITNILRFFWEIN